MTPHDFAHKIEKVYEENLESVILFGSAAGGDFSKKHSDFNVIVVLKDLSPVNLARSGKLVHDWVKKGNPVPHFFDLAHIAQSLDVFPLEFLDISERHQVLFGINPFKDIRIDNSNLRHQCESELKGKLLDMRAIYVMNYDRPKHISEIMLKTFPSFVSVFRGIVHLLGDEPDRETRKLVEQLAKRIDFNPQVFMDLIAVREGTMFLPRKDEAISAFENYLTEIQTITNYLDRLT